MNKYFSRKFIVTLIALVGGLVLGGWGIATGNDLTGVAAIIGAVGVIAGQYSVGNAMAKGKEE